MIMVALAFILGAQSSTNQQQSQSSNRGKLLSKRDESARHEETSPAAFTSLLSKINPWLSACDLAQPNTAPDLQVINQTTNPIFLLLCQPPNFSSFFVFWFFGEKQSEAKKLCRFASLFRNSQFAHKKSATGRKLKKRKISSINRLTFRHSTNLTHSLRSAVLLNNSSA